MGNSTITLQAMMDSIAAIGDIQTVFDHTGGWADEPAITIGNDVMKELLGTRFPWKWNRLKVPPFPLISLQQDYCSLNLQGIGWLENGLRIDINNSTVPPPTWPIFAVRDLQMSNVQGGFPYQFCWFYNRDLEQGVWPGAGVSYILADRTEPRQPTRQSQHQHPRRAGQHPGAHHLWSDRRHCARRSPWPDGTAPPPNYPAGVKIQDGTCVWTVANPDAQGFRFNPMPPSGGQVWLARLWAQFKAPTFTTLQQLLNPIPDDESKWFRDGCIAYAHRYSANPTVKARYLPMKQEWVRAMEAETIKNDREDESKGFFPDKSVMAPSYTTDPGPYPYRYGWR